jgi:hypothetical protein
MPKNLIDELKNLAQEILQLSEESEITVLRDKTIDLFEKITILNYEKESKNSLEEKESSPMESDKKNQEEPIELVDEKSTDKSEEELTEKIPVDLENLFIPTFDSIKEDMSQKEEFKDTITIEETERFFEKKRIEKIQKKPTQKRVEINSKQLSLHDKLLSSTIQIGLNDRIAFVNNLFNFSQADFNKVLSTLNDFENKKEAFDFINYTVKPKYNWNGKEDLVDRFLTIIERKYL